MNERTRYRVTGAIFLVALAVILIPMAFDGEGLTTVDLDTLPRPEVEPIDTAALDVGIDTAPLTRAAQMREQIDADGFDVSTGTRIGQPVLSPVEPGAALDAAEAWAVQVASFAGEANAVALRDRLRDDGYQTMLSDVKNESGVLTRVAVGPLVNREEANRLRRELSARYDTRAIVTRFGY